jgi:hypothetical protein
MPTTITITWAQVLEIHRSQTAVYFVDKKIASIICSPYQNKLVSDTKIVYSIPKRKHYLKLIEEIKSLIATNGPIKIFVKQDKNVWVDAGQFNLISYDEDESQTDFTLEK